MKDGIILFMLPKISTTKSPLSPHRPSIDLYEMRCDNGELDATYDSEIRWFNIANLDVGLRHRRNGIGKLLLRESLVLAEELDAKLIYAIIISRECLDAMRSVFGDKWISVHNEGSYAAEENFGIDRASAILHRDLS